jgi:hypothetical protein
MTSRDAVNVMRFLLKTFVIDVFVEFRRIPEAHYIYTMHVMRLFYFMNTFNYYGRMSIGSRYKSAHKTLLTQLQWVGEATCLSLLTDFRVVCVSSLPCLCISYERCVIEETTQSMIDRAEVIRDIHYGVATIGRLFLQTYVPCVLYVQLRMHCRHKHPRSEPFADLE